MTFRYSSHHPTCKSICKSGYVHKGCHYGHNCKINIHCTKNFCQCVLHLKCYPSSIGHAEYLSNEEIISQASYNVHEIVRVYFNYLGTYQDESFLFGRHALMEHFLEGNAVLRC